MRVLYNKKSLFRAFRKSDDGTTAIEFAMLSVPFTLLLVGLVETGLFFTAGVLLDGASQDAARLIRTGQAQNSGDPQTMFEDRLCQKVGVFIDCNDLLYEAIPVADNSFDSVDGMTPSFDEDGNLESQGFATGGSNDVVVIRVAYRYNFLTPFIGHFMGEAADRDGALLMTTVVARNEPYNFGEE